VAFSDRSWEFVTQPATDHKEALRVVRDSYENTDDRTIAFVHLIGSEEYFIDDADPVYRMYNPDRDPDEDDDEEWYDMEGDCDDDYLRQNDR
tara:strand:+ start:2691 stop:2966 length:276 start_codon:yes stop_codon:yes gene_type:complete